MSGRRHLKQLASESFVYGLSGIVARFLSIWLTPIYTRILTPDDYGVMNLVLTAMAVVTSFVALALDNAAFRWYWETDDAGDRRRTIASWAWCQLVVASAAGVAIWSCSRQIATLVTHRESAAVYFRILAFSLPLGTVQTVAIGWLRLQRRPWATVALVLGASVVQIVLTLTLVAGLRWGIRGVFVGQVVSLAIVSVVAVAGLLRRQLAPTWFDLARLRAMLHFSLPLVPAAVATWVVNSADRFFIEHYVSTSEVGFYSIGTSIAAVLALVTGAFQQAWGPFALSIYRDPSAPRTYAHVFLVYSAVTAIAAAGLSLFAPQAIMLLATASYLRATHVVGLMALSYAFIGLSYIASIGLSITKASRHSGAAVTLAALATIALNWLLVPRYGMVGSAIATLVGQAVAPAYAFLRAQQLYPVDWPFSRASAFYALALGLVALGETVVPARGFVAIGVRALLLLSFVPLLLILGVVRPDDVRRLGAYGAGVLGGDRPADARGGSV